MSFSAFWKRKEGEDLSWRMLKISFALVWLNAILPVFFSYGAPSMVSGCCHVLPCHWMAAAMVRYTVLLLALGLLVAYTVEWKMKWVSLLLFLVSGFIFSYEESNGVQQRTALFTLVFLFQTLAYFTRNPAGIRHFFSLQAVAATYMLSGISKLMTSGWRWPLDAPHLLLQIQKGAYYRYFDTGNAAVLQAKQHYIDFFAAHPGLLQVLLVLVLLLELTTFMILVNRRIRWIYGIALLIMHAAIYLVMDIIIAPVVYTMLIVLLNPLYGAWRGVQWAGGRLRTEK